jgi:Xaa-Pro aminopeptidase
MAQMLAIPTHVVAEIEPLQDLRSPPHGISPCAGSRFCIRVQIGLASSWAHAVAHNIEFRPGDVLVTETSAPIWGYNAELERAMVIGPPTDEMRRLFDHAVAAQQVALDALRPGVTCADVDGAVMRYFEDTDLLRHWRQHTGHAIGLRTHEAPFLDLGDTTTIEPGMVFTSSKGSTTQPSAASATRRRSSSDPTGSRC